jgi:hypothetical protein
VHRADEGDAEMRGRSSGFSCDAAASPEVTALSDTARLARAATPTSS